MRRHFPSENETPCRQLNRQHVGRRDKLRCVVGVKRVAHERHDGGAYAKELKECSSV